MYFNEHINDTYKRMATLSECWTQDRRKVINLLKPGREVILKRRIGRFYITACGKILFDRRSYIGCKT